MKMPPSKWKSWFHRDKKPIPTEVATTGDEDKSPGSTNDLWDVAYQGLKRTDASLVSLSPELEV